jgi:hypothetical protein
MIVEYDGTGFSGWQSGKNAPTIQASLEDALRQMTGVPTVIKGAGRDAGVHALGSGGPPPAAQANIPLHRGFRQVGSISWCRGCRNLRRWMSSKPRWIS